MFRGAMHTGVAVRWLAGPARRAMPPSLKLTGRCAKTLAALLESKGDRVSAIRIKMVNDWSSTTGFTFGMEFAESIEPGEEVIEQEGARLYVEASALFNTETGLLGSTLDMDETLELTIIPPPSKGGSR
ncbi:hypothetical protein T492DRAFT_1097722 [Pavlovales sp. CCMP2436]|nr:hypothetical protein T492DRAFT_1097722 [Pavlovales sp. CCMP2436]